MSFSDSFLDQLRAAIPVSAIVGRHHALVKRGTEFVSKDDPSISVNDGKGLWYDFGKGDDGGDIFQWLMKQEGMEFPAAVEECAKIAGIPMPKNGDARGSRPTASASPPQDDAPLWEPDDRGTTAAAKREITKTYQYTDSQGSLLYEVCRLEWEEKGKRKKTFFQRRPSPDGDGSWIVGLKPGEFIKSRRGDWIELTDDRQSWQGERRMFPVGVQHGLYRLVEFKELADPSEPVFLTEGEKDADTLTEWGLVATTNSGGAGNFRTDHAEMFRGLDVVLAIDSDEAGRKRADKIGQELRGIARRVRVLDFAAVWPGAPKGADVTDWKQQREGDRDELLTIIPTLPVWSPPPFVSKYGRVSWANQDRQVESSYEWWIKGLVPKRQTIAVVGPMSCGKSFETFNIGGHIAAGWDYRGQRTKQGLVVFGAPEGGAGTVNRMRAYRKENNLPLDGIPFEALTRRFNLFANDVDVTGIIEEVKAIAAEWRPIELALVIIDTWSAATSGMDENSSKDTSLVRSRIVRIQQECDCSVLFVHHTNASGERQRGHSSITADVDSVLNVQWVTRQDGKQHIPVTDNDDRKIRRITNFKQKEARDGQHWDFVIREVTLFRDADDDPVTSCITAAPNLGASGGVGEIGQTKIDNRIRLTPQRALIFNALRTAIEEYGEPRPTLLDLKKYPKAITTVVKPKAWKTVYLTKVADEAPAETASEDEKKKFDNTINKRLRDASEQFQNFKLIGRLNPYVWLTSRAAGPVKVEAIETPLAEGEAEQRDLDLPGEPERR